MSRSYRHTARTGLTTCRSEKEYKQRAHRRWRSAVKRALLAERRIPHWFEFSNPWLWGKDGKLDFDPAEFPRLLRK